MTSPLIYGIDGVQDLVKCCIKGWVHLNYRPENMLFGTLPPVVQWSSKQLMYSHSEIYLHQ